MNKKFDQVMVVVAFKVGVDFELYSSKIDKIDLELKIEAFALICFYFTSVSFSQFFSH